TGTYIHVTKFSEIGASGNNPTAVRDYILSTYNTWEIPPTHVLLVGDEGVAPVKYITLDGWTFTYDEYFVELTGNDYFPEMMIGRFTNQVSSRLNAMEQKLIGYERTPYVDDPNWFRKGIVCSNNAYMTQIYTKRFTAQQMLLHGNFISVDSMYNGTPCPGTVSTIINMVNEGRSFLNYRGEGWYTGWWASCFPLSVSNINSLNNGPKLTFVTSIGCGVANFEGTANNFGETWMEIGDGTAPRGACAFVGPVSNTHTNYNNEIDKGIYQGMFSLDMDSPGEALIYGRFRMYGVFGGADPYVAYHFRIYHILGDPTIHIWKDTPKNVNVDYNDTTAIGNGQVNVTVTYEENGLPVEGAKVCISSDSIYAVGFTAADGSVVLNIDPQETGELNFTVSDKDIIPFEGTIQVIEGGAGTGWQWVETGYPYTIYDVSFPPGQSDIGYAVGTNSTQNGIILKTFDGGISWTKISNDTIPGLRTVCFTTTEAGFVGGYNNLLLKTIDGGLSWTAKSIALRSSYVSNIRFWDANHGVAVNYPVTLFVTTDGGDNWFFAQGIKQTVEDVCFADENTLYMVGGDEMVSKSVNGGQYWDHIYSGTPFSKLVGVDFYTPDYGIAGGENGKIIITTDGGLTWSASQAGSTGLMHGINIMDEGKAFAAGTPEQVYKSTDGGATWISDFEGANTVELYEMIFNESRIGFICGSDGKFLVNHDYAIPVELTGFTAGAEGNSILLNWVTATETNNAGFDILRSTDGSKWEKIGFVEGAGTKSTNTNYSFKDQELKTGSYFYRLKQIDYDGSFKYSDKVNAKIYSPDKYSLEQNYPNPFNPVTTIRFTIPKEVMVSLTVYNIVGEKVRELKNEIMKPGYYQVDFDAAKIASGIYFYRLQAGDFISTKKMNLLK
ncbi:MAG TPA: C25 family cysteine peptidase, partial [Ignavibacteriaceae bacterium]|nr:C25 family cysteine peptidase [Ignavibacteriaceae bacterium]